MKNLMGCFLAFLFVFGLSGEDKRRYNETRPNDVIVNHYSEITGLTKREYFAAQCLSKLASWDIDTDKAAKRAVEQADALIRRLNE